MKLYTWEQMIEAFNYGKTLKGFDWIGDMIDSLDAIQLPSDEEIREERLLQFPDSEYANRANDRFAFYCGAKFVINKIQGGNK
jgi:hypothetical protein